MRKLLIAILFISSLGLYSYSQKVVRLYEGKAPGSEDWNYSEIESSVPGTNGKSYRNVVDPTLTVYLPEKSISTGASVIICPGGANIGLSFSSEGTEVAEWLVKKGITAFVLKYRLVKTPESPEEYQKYIQDLMKRGAALRTAGSTDPNAKPIIPPNKFGGDDGIKAMEFVRGHANEFEIDTNKVGIVGFSAGADVVMNVVLNSAPDKLPNFAAPIYGAWRGDAKIPTKAPPLFIALAADDTYASGSVDLYKAWRAAGFPAELHVYSKGGHGFGMTQKGLPVNSWIERFYDWIKVSGF